MDRESWQFINTFAPWLSALGTLGVVVVSLWLAFRGMPTRIKVSAGNRIIVGGIRPYPDYLVISIVNVGQRKVRITGIGWKIGWFKKSYAMQNPDINPFSSSIPVDLDESQEAKFLIPLKGEADWLNNFAHDFLGKRPRLNCSSIKIQAWTSVGKVFESRIEAGLRKKILEAYLEQNKK
ncbi:MAG TPA: hypothetical protein PLI72_10475 [Smithellaceae bacterium]|nr:hypothetical protein [Smithellaceae bacterium]